MRIIKMLIRSPVLASAGVMLHVGGAVAANSAGDAQALAREVLSPASTVGSAPSAFNSGDYSPVLDAQQRARELLAGTKKVVAPYSGRTVHSTEVEHSDRGIDPQALARRMILGRQA